MRSVTAGISPMPLSNPRKSIKVCAGRLESHLGRTNVWPPRLVAVGWTAEACHVRPTVAAIGTVRASRGGYASHPFPQVARSPSEGDGRICQGS